MSRFVAQSGSSGSPWRAAAAQRGRAKDFQHDHHEARESAITGDFKRRQLVGTPLTPGATGHPGSR